VRFSRNAAMANQSHSSAARTACARSLRDKSRKPASLHRKILTISASELSASSIGPKSIAGKDNRVTSIAAAVNLTDAKIRQFSYSLILFAASAWDADVAGPVPLSFAVENFLPRAPLAVVIF
jgi:hypothetical protein